jgi:hypothetical protein
MMKRVSEVTGRMRLGLWLAVGAGLLCTRQAAQAQTDPPYGVPSGAPFGSSGSERTRPGKERMLPDKLPEKPSLPPALTIPVEPLGFSTPGAIYLGQRFSMASLDFLDEDRLLFTFRVPGLIHREAGDVSESDVRQIRAVVLALPAGTIEAEGLWTVHDRLRYLWMLKDGHFLLRDQDGLGQGDAKLQIKPLLQFPGPLLWLQLDPSQQYMVTNSLEPAAAESKQTGSQQPDLVVRILHRETGQVMLVSRAHSTIHLPINSDGYLESLRGNGEKWVLNLNYFSGGSRTLGSVDSTCSPTLDFLSQHEVLVTACAGSDGRRLVAMDIAGSRLWEKLTSAEAIWPLLTMGPDGSRVALETVAVSHSNNPFDPPGEEDVKGQMVRVFDAANGRLALEAQASPALDAGGNVAISPSGKRVAVVDAGAIKIFDLPAPAALAVAPVNRAVR